MLAFVCYSTLLLLVLLSVGITATVPTEFKVMRPLANFDFLSVAIANRMNCMLVTTPVAQATSESSLILTAKQ